MKPMGNGGTWNGRKSAGWLGLVALVLGTICLNPVVRADDTGEGARAVRLSYVEGQVRIVQGGQVLAEPASANAPLFEGMQVATADDGRAEIQFEDGSVARISPDSAITLTALRGQGTGGDAEMTLNGGLAYFELQGGSQSGQMSVHFGDSVVTASGFTVLRVKMDTPPGELAVFSGNAHLEGGNGVMSLDLHGGESVTLNGSNTGRYELAESIEPDSWDAWNSDRDQELTAEASSQTGAADSISPDESQNPAWNDLDSNGNWYNVPGQGYVWSPYDASNAGWDPYGYGSWMFTPGYGYIWNSGYSWGYLPYQCGAWNFYDGFGWGWAPGLGGCQPWWGAGYYGGPRLGGFLPIGYHPPRRPGPPQHRMNGGPIPVIPVNRRGTITNTVFPARDRNAPVTIAGNTVQPLRPMGLRPAYAQPGEAFANREATVYGNTTRGAYTSQRSYSQSRGVYTTPAGSGQIHGAPASRSYSAPAPSHSYSGGSASHSYSGGGGAPHAS
ncbi:MAG: DUF6600 domain-containing protein, partial [Terracidiphilus sp.]